MNDQIHEHPKASNRWLLMGSLLAGTGLLAAGCSSGGGSGSAGSLGAGGFILEGTSVASGQTWKINRPIEFRFSRPVDFSTVNMNTLNIAAVTGGPAVGEFRLDSTRPQVVVFQPACPTQGDYSDAGLAPGGVQYRIDVPSDTSGATTVRSQEGEALAAGATLVFATPLSDLPIELFLDTATGPPAPIQGFVDQNGVVGGTRIEFDDPVVSGGPIPFVLVNGVGMLPTPGSDTSGGSFDEFEVPLNLYSDATARFSVVLELNQAVNPSDVNLAQDKLQFQFLNGGAWTTFPTHVSLAANCTDTGATLVIRPLGVLPQQRDMRILMSAEFEDIVGDRNILPLSNFARMTTRTFTDSTGVPVDFGDEVLEEFLVGGDHPASLEDEDAVFDTPHADWGAGELSAGFAFNGTGGPGGDFDWHIPPNTEFVLDTTSTVILGGPNGIPTTFQTVINGVVDLRNLFVPATSTLRIQGPNTALIQCSGEVRVYGTIRVSGGNAQPVFTLNTPFQPETGAAGNAGGGDGGVGSPQTTQVSVRGGNGNGMFNAESAGGEGGESGYSDNNANFGEPRRAAGGGGGTFGLDVYTLATQGTLCFDQTIIGLDAESGMPGSQIANAATRPGEVMPWGGMQATRPFNAEQGTDDDFYGTKRKNFGTPEETLVAGEMVGIGAGAGGGGGGDATLTGNPYPPPNLVNNNTDKGCGGGGGAGGLTILALGDIILGPTGRIEANGGHGSGGENTNYVNRIGGGSGGGSGGHIILQTASQIDLSTVNPATVAILARGGQGGAGTQNGGGADDTETVPGADSQHRGSNGTDLLDNPWIPPVDMACWGAQGVVRAAGGDGGPGIIQMHVGDLPGDIRYPLDPTDEENLVTAVKPPPIGYDQFEKKWVDQLLPSFGRFSKAQSKWVSLGGIAFDPDSPVPAPFSFLFEGTDPATGAVLRMGEEVVDLDPILAPAAPLEAAGLPELDPANPRRILFDANELTGDDEIYRRNPNLFRRFELVVGSTELDVESGSIDEEAGVLALTVASTGPTIPLAGAVQVLPRFLTVSTNGIPDLYPLSSEIVVEFQATSANTLGFPDANNIFPGDSSPETDGWTTDIEALNIPENATFRFLRFRVTFDIQADGGTLTTTTPRPQLDFLRVPFQF